MNRVTTFLAGGALLTAALFITTARGADEKQTPALPAEIMPPRWDGMRVGLEILVDGKPMRTIQHHGKTYLPVLRLGTEYEIRVRNYGPYRVAAMISVDGLSVLNGQPASEDHPGYIVAPRSSIVIKGWRRNMESVAAFSFEERDKSYAARVGRPENIGVLGLIAVEELAARPRPLPTEKRARAPESALKDQSTVGGTGTGYGREIDSRIYYVNFVRSNNKRTVTMYYDTVENLRKAGVPVDRPMPVPFPADSEFVPPPPEK
jgi:hypothetical protein